MREEIKAGLTIIMAMFILTLSVIVIGGSRLFDSFDTYYTRLFNVTGLETGSMVKLGGMTIGRVLSIRPPQKENEPIVVEFGITKGTPLYEGMKASISQVGFVGDIFLQLSLTGKMGKRLSPGETIPSIEQSNFNTMMAKAEALTVSLKALVEDLNMLFNDDNIRSVVNILTNTNQLIVNTDQRLDSVVGSVKVLSERLSAVLSRAESLVSKTETLVDENMEGLRELISKARDNMVALERLIVSLQKASTKLDSTLLSATDLIDHQNENLNELFTKAIKATEALNEAITEFNQRPWRVLYKERTGKEE